MSIEDDNNIEPELSRRDMLEAAFDEAEETHAAEAKPADPVEPAAPEEIAGEPADSGDRDERGRFKAKAAAEKPEAVASPQAPAEGQPAPEAQAAKVDRAPQSWRPLARENWGSLPPDVKSEVMRREQEITRTLSETAEARKTAQAFEQAWRPYEQFIRAEGSDPIQAVGHLMQTAAMLRTAPPVQKAQLVASIIHQYGVDVAALDAALAGAPMPQMPHQAPMSDPRVDQLFSVLSSQVQQKQEREYNQAVENVEAFGADKPYFEDVRSVMADLIEVAERNGRTLSLDQAYNQAIRLDPEIAQVIQQREARERAQTAQATTGRARAAASSLRSNPAPGVGSSKTPSTRREALEQAFDQYE